MNKQQEIINNILRRLDGYPVGSMDSNYNPLVLGEEVKFYYGNCKYVKGMVAYNYDKDKFMIYLKNPTPKFNNIDNIFYLAEEEGGSYPNIERISYPKISEYNKCISLAKNDDPFEFFFQIFELQSSAGLYLNENELEYIEKFLANYDEKDEEPSINMEEVFKRLNGYNTGIMDFNGNHIRVGDKVSIYYDTFTHDKNVSEKGIVKYDVSADKFYIKFHKEIKGLTNISGQVWLNSSISNILDNSKSAFSNQSDFERAKEYFQNKNYIQLYQHLLTLFNKNKLYLKFHEVEYIKNYLKNENNIEKKNDLENNTNNKDTVVIQMSISCTYPDTMKKVEEMLTSVISSVKDLNLTFIPPSHNNTTSDFTKMQQMQMEGFSPYGYSYKNPIIR